MKSFASLLLALITALTLTPPKTSINTADLVFKNGNIYTANERQPKAEAIAVKGDRIIFVGSNRDAQKYVGKATRVIDLKGKTVVPGMTDSHQ
ncbi:MAG: amidohydrolase, partial [Acidobacteriota bacterium]|nr:amidohydrolase [Acidobacteriota bacterium]